MGVFHRIGQGPGRSPATAAPFSPSATMALKLPDIPLDVLYEVSYGVISVADLKDGDASHVPDILSCLPGGSAASIVDQQDLS